MGGEGAIVSEISVTNIVNAGDFEHLSRMMYLSIKQAYKANLFTPTLCLICISIDGLGNGNKDSYIKILQDNFSEICSSMKPYEFYDKYRNGVAHYFRMKEDFAIKRNSHMQGKYIETQTVKETGATITSLNIDRFAEDFLRLLVRLREEKGYTGIYDTMKTLDEEKKELDAIVLEKQKN